MTTTILLAEDNALFREPVAHYLRRAGYRVLVADNGEQAVDTLRAEPAIAMLLLDYAMPGMDGVTLLRRLRQTSQWRDLPVLLLTARSAAECIEETRGLALQGVLQKSQCSLKQIVERVRELLGESHAADAAAP